MKIIPVALALFNRKTPDGALEVWVQTRDDDGPFHGLEEFPGGGIEPNESPLEAVIREVQEEVGITINPADGILMGTYPNVLTHKTVLLYVFLFPDQGELSHKGQWLRIAHPELSEKFRGIIPPPNHRIIDDLFLSVYSAPTEHEQ